MDHRSIYPFSAIAQWLMELRHRACRCALISIDIQRTRLTSATFFPHSLSKVKVTLHELCRVMGLPGKPDGMSGAEVEKYYRDGHIREIAEYCESDVIDTYRVWLRYELFRGELAETDFHASEANLAEFVRARGNTKPHLSDLM